MKKGGCFFIFFLRQKRWQKKLKTYLIIRPRLGLSKKLREENGLFSLGKSLFQADRSEADKNGINDSADKPKKLLFILANVKNTSDQGKRQ
jgi:hypothetical protein